MAFGGLDVLMADVQERRYAIGPDGGYFSAGVTVTGQQALLGLFCPNIVAFFFDRHGHLLRITERPVPFFHNAEPPYNIYDHRIEPLIESWKAELGFQATTIHVRKFFSVEQYIGIEDYPSHFQEILSDPDVDDDERADVRESMKLWDEDGQFVLHWGNDYWLDGHGRVVSS